MTKDSGGDPAATLDAAAIGCIFASDEPLDAAVTRLVALGLDPSSLHVGAADAARAKTAGQRNSISADLDPDDPLGLIPGSGSQTRAAVDRGGVVGGLVGAIVGAAIGFGSAGTSIITHAPPVLGNVALWFAIGAIVGSVLGAALAPQPSTHVGFRLIDGMQEGGYALVVVAPRARVSELRALLQSLGGTGLTPG